jgi:hypothetical protein
MLSVPNGGAQSRSAKIASPWSEKKVGKNRIRRAKSGPEPSDRARLGAGLGLASGRWSATITFGLVGRNHILRCLARAVLGWKRMDYLFFLLPLARSIPPPCRKPMSQSQTLKPPGLQNFCCLALQQSLAAGVESHGF